MRPKRSLGQNFLIDPNLQRKIVDALEVAPDDEVLEIGPGRGALTRHLAETGARLTLVELDDSLAEELQDRYAGRPDVRVVHGDVLELDLNELVSAPEELLVVGNLPYNITTPILFRLLKRPRPRRIVAMVQKEVGERIVAEPGTGEYGALSVGIRSVATVERLFDVGRKAFRPVPRVDSTVLRIVPSRPPPLGVREEERLRELTRASFQWRRKQIGTVLRRNPAYSLSPETLEELADETGFDLRRRPETFSPDDLLQLTRALASRGRPLREEGG